MEGEGVEGEGELNKALSLLFGNVRTFVFGVGAAFRHQALSDSSTISFQPFKFHLFSLICCRISSYPIFTFLLVRISPPPHYVSISFLFFFSYFILYFLSFFVIFHSFIFRISQKIKISENGGKKEWTK